MKCLSQHVQHPISGFRITNCIRGSYFCNVQLMRNVFITITNAIIIKMVMGGIGEFRAERPILAIAAFNNLTYALFLESQRSEGIFQDAFVNGLAETKAGLKGMAIVRHTKNKERCYPYPQTTMF